MKDNLRFVDSDMHVMEPPDLFERYLDPKFRDRVSVRVGSDGRPDRGPAGQILIDGQFTSDADFQQYRKRTKPVAKNSTQPLSGSRIFEAKRLDFAIERDYDPQAQVTGMAMEGVDIAVLYPTMGLGLLGRNGIDPLLSLGVCQATGRSAWAAARAATPAACAVPVAVPLLFWVKTRSIATTSGRYSRSSTVTAVCSSSSRSSRSSSAIVRITPTPSAVGRAPGRPSTTPHPHRVRPGSIPSTRMKSPPVSRTPVRPRLAAACDTPAATRPRPRPEARPEPARGEGDGVLYQASIFSMTSSDTS